MNTTTHGQELLRDSLTPPPLNLSTPKCFTYLNYYQSLSKQKANTRAPSSRAPQEPLPLPPLRNRPIRLKNRQCHRHWPIIYWHRSQTCTFIKACRNCMAWCPYGDCFNKFPTLTPSTGGRPRAPTSPRILTNMNQNVMEASEASPILFQVSH